MTRKQKADVLLTIVECAPISEKTHKVFKGYAADSDADAMWTYFINAINSQPQMKRRVEGSGEVSFEMLQPAMETIYRLPTDEDDGIPF